MAVLGSGAMKLMWGPLEGDGGACDAVVVLEELRCAGMVRLRCTGGRCSVARVRERVGTSRGEVD